MWKWHIITYLHIKIINLTFYILVYTDGKIMQKCRFNVVKKERKPIFFSQCTDINQIPIIKNKSEKNLNKNAL